MYWLCDYVKNIGLLPGLLGRTLSFQGTVILRCQMLDFMLQQYTKKKLGAVPDYLAALLYMDNSCKVYSNWSHYLFKEKLADLP